MSDIAEYQGGGARPGHALFVPIQVQSTELTLIVNRRPAERKRVDLHASSLQSGMEKT